MNGSSQFQTLRNRKGYPVGKHLQLAIPVVQAPLGSCDGPRLAGNVSRAGGLGCLSVHATPEPVLERQLTKIKQITHRPVMIALTAQWERDRILEICLEEGFRFYQTFWWNVARQAKRIHRENGIVFSQVGSMTQAIEALDHGVDGLIAQGTEAGGQVRSPYPLRQLVTDLLVLTDNKIPIIAGGGLADARDVAAVLSWGASAAFLGTRFLLTEEAHAPAAHKARLRRARTENLILDPRLVGDWPCSPRRRLITAREEDTASLFAGRGLSRINRILPVAELLPRLFPLAYLRG
ncbi:MAG: enoyl-[acyl-carrier-protein] reductase FabK [Armatimonadaceae bacterium]